MCNSHRNSDPHVGTNQWRGGSVGYEKLSKSTVIQMVGRAGRVGFDTSGVAVIMTTTEDRAHYDMDAMEMETVESTLPAILIEGRTACIAAYCTDFRALL